MSDAAVQDPAESDAERYRVALGTSVVSAVALVGFLAIYATALTFGNEAAFFPQIVATVGAASSAVALIASIIVTVRLRPSAAATPRDPVNLTDWLVSYGGPPVYGVMIYCFGFWVASTLGILGLLFALGERRPLFGLSITAGTLLLIYLVFEVSFDIRMPGSYLYELLARD